MFKKKREILFVAALFFAPFLMSGCSLIQEDGTDRHLLAIEGKISVLGGSTNTRLVTRDTEKTLQESTKPTIREAQTDDKTVELLGNPAMDTETKKGILDLLQKKKSILAYNEKSGSQ